MNAILGVDAAWTPRHPSGVALVKQGVTGTWECIELAGSYSEFLEKSGMPADGIRDPLPIQQVLRLSERRCGGPVRLVAADLPLSTQRITKRREADNEVSRKFGSCKCSTHSPTGERPGQLSERYRMALESSGFRLATSAKHLSGRALIEVYPHPALLALLDATERIPYKWSKKCKYWPNETTEVRGILIIEQLERILEALKGVIRGIPLKIDREARTGIKAIEDQIDALVCAWVGILTLEGKTTPLGNEDAAIWVPTASVRIAGWAPLLNGAPASPDFMHDVEDLPPQERACFTT